MLNNLLLLFLVVSPNLALCFLILKSKRKKAPHVYLLNTIFSIIGWAFGIFLFSSFEIYTISLIGIRIAFAMVSLIAFFFLNFTRLLYKKTKVNKFVFIFLSFLSSLIFITAILTNLIVQSVTFQPWGADANYGLLYPFFFFYFLAYIIAGLIILIIKYKKAQKIKKQQLKYVFLGFLVAAIFGSSTNLIIPALTGMSVLSKFGPLSTIFLVGFTTYAILKYRLLDIRVFIKQGTIYFFSFIITISAGTILAITLHKYSSINPTTVGITIIIFVLLIFNPLKNIIRKIANRIMFRAVYTYQEALKELSNKVTIVIDLKELLKTVADVLFKVMQIERVGFLLKQIKDEKYLPTEMQGFENMKEITLNQGFFSNYLAQNPEALVTEELELMEQDENSSKKKKKFLRLIKNMKKIKAALVLPLASHKELIGLIILGPKEDQRPYSKEDIDLLENLSRQTSLAVENATLYNNMSEMVNQKTQQVKEKVEEVRRTNLKLKKANQIREEFLSIASHQLRTPLSAAWSVMSSFADGTLENETPAERQRFYKMAFDSLERLNNIVNDLLDGAEVERKKLNIQKKEINVIYIIKDSVNKGKEEAEKKGISLVLKIDDNTPKTIFADEKYLRMVFVNLLDNAIKYTPEDLSAERKKILIKVFSKTKSIETEKDKKKKRFLVFIIQDQGIGVPKAEQNNLFKQFKRASNARKVDISGTGLGLYIVKKVIQQHNGTIEMQSKGEDKGTKFRVEVPA